MASISKEKTGYRVQWMAGDNTRHTLRLGAWNVDKAGAASVARKIEQLLANLITGDAPKPELAAWLRDIPDDFHQALAKRGLLASRQLTKAWTLGELCDAYFAAISVKGSTLLAYRQCEASLVEHFGKAKPLAAIGAMHAEAWAKSLRDAEYAPATVSKMVKIARGIFGRGVRWKMLGESPFAEVKAGSQRNPERSVFVPRETIAKVLDACPDAEWRLIVALSRFGGLRCPSEHQALRWGDVDWDACRMLVRSSKTEHHAGGESRAVPIFPELMPYLRDAYEHADDGVVWAIARYRGDNANLRTQLLRILAKAGVKPWPRLFHNLRASRQTELHAEFPLADACAWLGNSPAVASAHYIQATDANFRDATKRATGPAITSEARGEKRGAKSDAQAVQNATLRTSAGFCDQPQESSQPLADCSVTHKAKDPRTFVQGSGVGATGLEPVTSAM